MAITPETKHLLRREGIVVVKLLVPFFSIMAVVVYFHEFVVNAIMANVAINGLIMAAALYGVIMIVVRLIGAQMDFAVIERFGREAMNGVYMRQLLEEPWLKKRYVRHYLGHIALTGGTLSSALEQNAIENELKALSTEYDHKLELPQFIVGFMIAMGLLGTFIGLLQTLTGISGMLDGFGQPGANMDEQFMKLVVELRKPLAGMGIAFSASMFGLVTSLMLAMMMISLRRYIGRVVSCARNVMHDLTELTHTSVSASTAVTQLTPEEIASMASGGGGGGGGRKNEAASIAEGELTLQDLVYQSHDTSLMMANRIDVLTQKMEKLFQVIEGGIAATNKTNDLLGFGPRMKETSEKMLDELRSLNGVQLEQQRLSLRFLESDAESAKLLETLAQVQREAQAGLTISFKDLADVQREAQSGLSLSFKDLTEKLGKIEEGNHAVGKHLWDIKENFTKFGAYSGIAETISTGIGHQTLLLETLIKEDRNLQKRLVSIQQDIRERSLASTEPQAAVPEEEPTLPVPM
jgi:hypothetical protein